MFSLQHGRDILYKITAKTFEVIKLVPNILELGVHNGSNAVELMQTFNPLEAYFIDAWDSKSICENYSPFEVLPDWVSPVEDYSHYFGGDIRLQETFDRLYQDAKLKLEIFPNANVIKSSTTDAFYLLKNDDTKFDFIYVDASHQYEFVFRDLMEYSKLLNDNGFMQLNDCVLSEPGTRQNLGVLRALHEFVLRNKDFIVLAQTAGEWADVSISRRGSHTQVFESIIRQNNLNYVEIPRGCPNFCVNGVKGHC